ncbi:SGNH/GDSL hydrolase family protein [Paenibacillus zeisoli]|uniref:SGNH/GDSL hydrolase family protein n=1 Tax=Paenibacillus zeisoli TaxID=2496267 RepID=A0A3S1BCA2_9BACL|nr:SGNH/GDSL hydrolase family protein [Paenibacillus zeisoli]RUT36233.1 SGNH/GDSL hydrolase family protein [Paenibacillus zeisoli]
MSGLNQRQEELWNKDYVSVTALSSAANFIMNEPMGFTHTYRTYLRPRETGRLQIRIWHSNSVDSTWDMGQDAAGSEAGGSWRIESAFLGDGGRERDGSVVAGSLVPLTFGGSHSREVEPGERFYSDEVTVDIAEGHDLVFSWTLSAPGPGKSIPYNVEGMLASAYDAEGHLADQVSFPPERVSEQLLVMPSFIGYKRENARKIVILGDSITQGVRTEKDAYAYWAARIADSLGPEYGVWNLGSGWGRAYDAASDGPWLHKAKQGDEVLIVLGVNDIDVGKRSAEELLHDLGTIVAALRENRPGVTILLSTVPPFNFMEEREQIWRTANKEILNHPPAGVDYIYDIARVLSQPEPQEHRIKPEYMSSPDDPHPNGPAGEAVAKDFLNWYAAVGGYKAVKE